MEAYCRDVKPSVEIQKNLCIEVTYIWRYEECVGHTEMNTVEKVFCAKGTGLWTFQSPESGDLSH